MAKCGKTCPACPYVKTGSEIKIDRLNTWKITRKFTCDTYNCVYLIECDKCRQKYIGETGRLMKHRFSEHRGYVNNQVKSVATAEHFNLPGHSLANMTMTILEQVKKKNHVKKGKRKVLH